jgi:hypothetical protein
MLPAAAKGEPHHPALGYRELPPFMADLRRQEGMVARALEFTILTAARGGERQARPGKSSISRRRYGLSRLPA